MARELIVKTEITDQYIDDMITGALEGGINYWAVKAVPVDYLDCEFASEVVSKGGTLKIYLDEPFDDKETSVL